MAKSGSELGEQSALFCWAATRETREAFPGIEKLYANYNNAGNTADKKANAIRGAQAKAAGLKSGVADTFLPLARHGMHGLYIELKIDPNHPANNGSTGKKRSGVSSPAQIAFRKQVIADGYGHAVCHGWKAAMAVLMQYLTESA